MPNLRKGIYFNTVVSRYLRFTGKLVGSAHAAVLYNTVVSIPVV